MNGAKAVVAIGCSIHASEIGATQSANDLLYELATASDARTVEMLDRMIVILMPSLNPDGHQLVTDWHKKTQGTPFEGGPMPWSYHKYVGHDINRDAFMLNMAENRTLARFFSREWHPQVFLAMHQMGSNGPRFFVPPNYDPIDTNQDPLIWREAALLGSAMALELESQGKSGVVSNAMYDYYWPGYEDSAPLGRNTVCLLTEVASAKLASPIDVAAKDLRGATRGLPQYAPQINFPNPWPGGTWRLGDIVDYNLAAMRGLLQAASRYRDELVSNFVVMGRRSSRARHEGKPLRVRDPARPARPRRCEQAHQPAGGGRRRGAAGVGAVQTRRHRLSRRHGVRHHGPAVPGVRQEPARAAEVPRARSWRDPPRRSGRTTWPGGRFRSRWASASNASRPPSRRR